MLDSKVVSSLKSGGAFLTGQGCARCLGGFVCASLGACRHCLAVMDVGLWCVGVLVKTQTGAVQVCERCSHPASVSAH